MIASLVKTTTGLEHFDADAYLEQAAEIATSQHVVVASTDDVRVDAASTGLTLASSRVRVVGGAVFDLEDPARSIPTAEAFQIAEVRHDTLGATGAYNTPTLGGDYRGGTIGASPAYSTTAHVAEVSVDAETGIDATAFHVYSHKDDAFEALKCFARMLARIPEDADFII